MSIFKLAAPTAFAIIFSIVACSSNTSDVEKVISENIYQFSVVDIDGNEVRMNEYEGKVLLIVNVASKCGFTKQYAGLQEIYDKYKDKGFVVLGFPCNQFGAQEPGTEEQIKEFCEATFGVTFPMFSKVVVNGDDAHPLYKYLKNNVKGTLGTEDIKWNFTKFLVDRNGTVIEHYGSTTTPASIAEKIEKLL